MPSTIATEALFAHAPERNDIPLLHRITTPQATEQNKSLISLQASAAQRCSPFPCGIEPGAGVAVPGAVGISCEAAVSAGGTVDVAAMQGNLGHPFI